MPDGPVHNSATLTIAIASVPALLLAGVDWRSALACSGGALSGMFMHPDWDIDGAHLSAGELVRRPGKFMWRVFLRPYAKFCKHRSFASHAPVFSTLGRLAYLAAWLVPVAWYVGFDMPPAGTRTLWALTGLVMADTVHWGLDMLDAILGGRL